MIGRKDLNNSNNIVGYSNNGSSISADIYQANFEYQDYVIDSSVSTIYYVAVPEDENIVKFPLTYRIETEHVELFPFSIKKTKTSGDWVTITYNYTKETE